MKVNNVKSDSKFIANMHSINIFEMNKKKYINCINCILRNHINDTDIFRIFQLIFFSLTSPFFALSCLLLVRDRKKCLACIIWLG